MNNNAITGHYDFLIDENNHVHAPEPLKAYMYKWDGQDFINKMEMTTEKSVP